MKAYSFHQISSILGARAPMLMLDVAELSNEGDCAVGRKAVSIAEGVFQGHFPGQPILPGVLQLTAMSQLARLLFKCSLPGIGGTDIVLCAVKRLKFRKPVLPGMIMEVEAKIQERKASGEAEFLVSCTTEQGVASTGVIQLARINSADFEHPRTASNRPASPFAEELAKGEATDAIGLMKLLPHRPPFLLLDKAIGIGNPESKKIFGYKNLSCCDMMMAGTGNGIYPSPLMLESAAQLGCAHILSQPGVAGKLGIFLCIDEAHFYQHARVGDQLVITGSCDVGGRAGTASGELWVDDQKIGDCSMKFILVDSLKQ